MNDEHHRIESFRFNIITPDDISAHEMQDSVSYIFKHYIQSELSQLLTQCAKNKLITLDKLEIDLGELHFDDLHNQLPKRILKSLRQQILSSIREKPSLQKEPPKRSLQILIHLLQYGSTPWWAPQAGSRSFRYWIQTAVEEAPQQLLDFLNANLQHNNIRTRLLHNITPAIHEKLTNLTNPQNTSIDNSQLINFLQQPQTKDHSTSLENLIQFLQRPPSSPSEGLVDKLLQQAITDHSHDQISKLLHTTFQSSYFREELIQKLSDANLKRLIRYLSPSEHELLIDQTNAVISIIQHHFLDKPHLGTQLQKRLWNLSITHFLDASSNSNHTQTLIYSLQNEQHISTPSLVRSAEHYLQQQHNLSHNIQQQIKSFTQNINPPPDINQLFQDLDKQHSTNTETNTVNLLKVLRTKSASQLRQVFTQKNHLQIILNAPTSIRSAILSLLHPDPNPIIQQLEPLQNKTFPNQPWSGNRVYYSMIQNLITTTPSTKGSSLSVEVDTLAKQTASQLNIPKGTWHELITPILRSSSTTSQYFPQKHTEHKQALDIKTSSHTKNTNIHQQALSELWAAMLEKLWHTDPISTIQQVRNAALSGSHFINYYQSITTTLLNNLIEILYPDSPSTIINLLTDLHSLHKLELLPQSSEIKNLNALINPTLILALTSTRILSHTPSSITKTLLHELAQHCDISLSSYLQQLQQSIENQPNKWTPKSALPSHIQSFITATSLNLKFTESTLKKSDPLLIQRLKNQINKRIRSINLTLYSSQYKLTELPKIILTRCLTQLPSLWPDHTQAHKIIDVAFHELSLTSDSAEFPRISPHLQNIHSLLTAETPIPEDSLLLNSLTIVSQQVPHYVIPLLAKHIHDLSFLERLQVRTIKLQSQILHLLAPEATYLIKALIVKMKHLSPVSPEKTLWRRATHSISQLYPHKLEPKNIILHFLTQDTNTPPEEQAHQLLQIQPIRRSASEPSLNLILYEISTNKIEPQNTHSIKKTWANFKVAQKSANSRIKQKPPHSLKLK